MKQKNTAPLKPPGQRSKDELRVSLYSLADTCPVAECDLENCPLFKVRKMNFTERFLWFNALSEHDVVYLNAYHHVCLSIKLATKVAE